MKQFWLPALGVVVLAGGILVGRPGTTAPAKGVGDTEISVGYVDVQKVLLDSPAAVEARKHAEDLKTQLQGQLALQGDLLFLSDAEQTELNGLEEKPQTSLSDKEKQRIAQLQKQSHDAEAELLALQQKSQPTDTEKSRMSDLSNMRSRNTTRLQKAQQSAQEDLDKQAGALMDQLQERILKVVEQVATQEKLAMVVDKQARLYGGRDITGLVVDKLKK
jgi:Skp family chaperone for outer membrane proteins